MSLWDGEDDPVAEPSVLSAAPEDDGEAGDAEPDSDVETEGDGVPDPTLAVRVWLDEHRRLQRVRVSNKWRRRVVSSSLGEAFRNAFALANARLVPAPALGYPVPGAAGALSWDLVAALADQAETNAALPELDPDTDSVRPDRVRPDVTRAQNQAGTVRVTLGPSAQTTDVWFDDDWLKTVRLDDLVEGVMDAHAAAYAAFRPGDLVPGSLRAPLEANVGLALEADAHLRRASESRGTR